ncbi:MAG: hypothetical protein KKD28_09185 [Chloroflexi bacterium]|nr:hypothetical protein [Chloroflexota bacterium]MBU1661632.1 hypothetical protein [Chloroflexota bacterium]
MKRNTRILIWLCFSGAVLLVLGLKAQQLGWLQPRPSLELNGQLAVLIFVKIHGVCECEQFVNGNARSQVANWPTETRYGLPLHQIDIEQRPDLAERYKVIRAPSMLLLDASGEIVWRQDDVISDGLPLDIEKIEVQIATLIESP